MSQREWTDESRAEVHAFFDRLLGIRGTSAEMYLKLDGAVAHGRRSFARASRETSQRSPRPRSQ